MKSIILLSGAYFAFSFSSNKILEYEAKFVEKNFKLIPSATFSFGIGDQDAELIAQDKSGIVSVESFYMLNQEISNDFYKRFVMESRIKLDSVEYKALLPDTLCWQVKKGFMEPYCQYYFRHPAYNQFPVVGVSHAQANKFCEWLTNKYNSDPKRKFGKVKFDLPTEIQWIWASQGGLNRAKFPWSGGIMQNSKGQWLANFKPIDQSGIIRMEIDQVDVFGNMVKNEYTIVTDTWTGNFSDNADVTAPVISYWPNGYGLYQMSGNVEEMVKEEGITKGGSWCDTGYYLQINSKETYTDATKTSNEKGFRVVMNVEKIAK